MFMNKYGELRSGWSIALAFVVYFIVQLLVSALHTIFMLVVMVSSSSEISLMEFALNVPPWLLILSNVASFAALLLLFKLIYKRPFSQLGFAREGGVRNFILGCLIGVVSISAVFLLFLVTGQISSKFIELNQEIVLGIIASLLLHLSVGFMEETLTRGYLMTALKTTRNIWVIVLVPAFLFGIMHAFNLGFNFLAFINIMLVGIVFALMFIRTGSLWMPIAFHFAWNFVQGSVFGFNVSGINAVSILQTNYLSVDWLTGGYFGPEASILTTLVLLVLLAAVYFLIKPAKNRVWTPTSDLPFIRNRILDVVYPAPHEEQKVTEIPVYLQPPSWEGNPTLEDGTK